MFILQLFADAVHFSSFIVLLRQILKRKQVEEISYRTQEIFFVCFCFRYSNLVFRYISLYNTLMKLFYLGVTGYIIFLVKFKRPYCLLYDPTLDSFNHYRYLYPAALFLTLLFHVPMKVLEPYKYFFSFSLWLESLAIVPQLQIVYKKREVEVITATYMALCGVYRIIYMVNWIYGFVYKHELVLTKFLSGMLQFIIYSDFLYYFFISARVNQSKIQLPF